MSIYDLIWVGVFAVYLFQTRNKKGFMYDWVKRRASKRDGYNEEKFQKSQYQQVALFATILLILRVFQIWRGVRH
jgi:hypothetical protein